MKIVGILFFLAAVYYLLWFLGGGGIGSIVGFDILLVAGTLFYLFSNTEKPDKLWFRAKRYGYGWGIPYTWQGWVVMLVYTIAMVLTIMVIDRGSHSVSDTLIGTIPTVGLLVAALIAVCYRYGEKPEWRWGKKNSS